MCITLVKFTVIISDKTIKVGRTVRCLHQSSCKAPSQHFNGLDFWCRQLWPGISYFATNRRKVTLRLRWTRRDDEHASRYGRHYRVVLQLLSPVLDWRSSGWCTKHLVLVCRKLSFNWQASDGDDADDEDPKVQWCNLAVQRWFLGLRTQSNPIHG